MESDRRIKKIGREFEEAVEKHTKKRVKPIEDSPLEMEEKVSTVKGQMRDAAIKDRKAIELKKPAKSRLKMLPDFVGLLENNRLHEVLLDANVLEEVKYWLEPLAAGVFPCPEIREALIRLLFELPVEVEHLRRSGVGRILMFYSKRKEPYFSETRRLSKKLIKKWTRDLFME